MYCNEQDGPYAEQGGTTANHTDLPTNARARTNLQIGADEIRDLRQMQHSNKTGEDHKTARGTEELPTEAGSTTRRRHTEQSTAGRRHTAARRSTGRTTKRDAERPTTSGVGKRTTDRSTGRTTH